MLVMKRILYIIMGVTLMMTGCNKEDSDNGNLDGFWQMTEMRNKSNASTSDMRSSGITWAFQGNILELRDVKKSNQDIIMSFSIESDKLKLFAPYIVDRDSHDIQIDDVDFLIPYGIDKTTTEYSVSELSSSRMVLDNDAWYLVFRKY